MPSTAVLFIPHVIIISLSLLYSTLRAKTCKGFWKAKLPSSVAHHFLFARWSKRLRWDRGIFQAALNWLCGVLRSQLVKKRWFRAKRASDSVLDGKVSQVVVWNVKRYHKRLLQVAFCTKSQKKLTRISAPTMMSIAHEVFFRAKRFALLTLWHNRKQTFPLHANASQKTPEILSVCVTNRSALFSSPKPEFSNMKRTK